jgi:hypothetical protein
MLAVEERFSAVLLLCSLRSDTMDEKGARLAVDTRVDVEGVGVSEGDCAGASIVEDEYKGAEDASKWSSRISTAASSAAMRPSR